MTKKSDDPMSKSSKNTTKKVAPISPVKTIAKKEIKLQKFSKKPVSARPPRRCLGCGKIVAGKTARHQSRCKGTTG